MLQFAIVSSYKNISHGLQPAAGWIRKIRIAFSIFNFSTTFYNRDITRRLETL